MSTSTVKYQGQLRTLATHTKSGETFITDAPADNHGLGLAFSPTDTVATSLATCMITLMGITAKTHQINIDGTWADVTKVMTENPRRISEVQVDLHIKDNGLDAHQKTILERAAITCPVAQSLNKEINQVIKFNYF
ncbi:MAG: OsmC family protein [Bacteroidota bacterium]|nr:OsmC family protein [Bacteroidota bacterium]